MPTLLHISASPRGDASESLALAEAFMAELNRLRPDIDQRTWDLWDGSLPDFGPAAAAAKMAVFAGASPQGEQASAWRLATETFQRFADADCYLFSVPMWNAGVPYVLKQLIDVISQPGYFFSFDPEVGYTGLLTGRKAVTIYTSAIYGQGRPPEFGADFQAPFLQEWLRWSGIEEAGTVTFRPNLVTSDVDQQRGRAIAEALRVAEEIARGHAAAVLPEFLTP